VFECKHHAGCWYLGGRVGRGGEQFGRVGRQVHVRRHVSGLLPVERHFIGNKPGGKIIYIRRTLHLFLCWCSVLMLFLSFMLLSCILFDFIVRWPWVTWKAPPNWMYYYYYYYIFYLRGWNAKCKNVNVQNGSGGSPLTGGPGRSSCSRTRSRRTPGRLCPPCRASRTPPRRRSTSAAWTGSHASSPGSLWERERERERENQLLTFNSIYNLLLMCCSFTLWVLCVFRVLPTTYTVVVSYPGLCGIVLCLLLFYVCYCFIFIFVLCLFWSVKGLQMLISCEATIWCRASNSDIYILTLNGPFYIKIIIIYIFFRKLEFWTFLH